MHEVRARAVAAVVAGESLRVVARRFDLTAVTLMRWRRLDSPDDPATVAAALACLADSWTPLEVAHAANVSPEQVRRWQREAKRAARSAQ